MRLSSTSRFNLFLLLLLAVLTTYAACGGRNLVNEATTLWDRLFGPRTTRQLYARELRKNDLLTEREFDLWNEVHAVSQTTPLSVDPPHREVFRPDGTLLNTAHGFMLHLPPGRLLRLSVLYEGSPVFGELYRREDGTTSKRPLAWWTDETREVTYETSAPAGEDLTVIVQAAPAARAAFELRVTTAPVIQFPVAGKEESAIQSFWGAPRDGGRRRHEGNDVFAPRGTELLAVTDGEITRVGNGGLGGKTVWLRDRARGLRYYYAHLDEQRVRPGQRVRRGEVIGTVGNTGNARTTPPHLHFGVYRRRAIDPYPFLRREDELPPASPLSLPDDPAGRVPERGNHYLRYTPARNGEVIRQLENREPVILLGKTGRFYRLRTRRGETAYANFD